MSSSSSERVEEEAIIQSTEKDEIVEEAGRQLLQRLGRWLENEGAVVDAISLPLLAVLWLLQSDNERLYSCCCHLRITSDPWPAAETKRFIRIQPLRPLRALFPQLHSVWFDHVPDNSDLLLLDGIRVLRMDGTGNPPLPQTHTVSLQRSDTVQSPPLILASLPQEDPLLLEKDEDDPSMPRALEAPESSRTGRHHPASSLTHLQWSHRPGNVSWQTMVRTHAATLQSIRLSHNAFATQDAVFATGALDHCLQLRHLDLSHNQLPSLSRAPYHWGHLCHLHLAHNQLTTLAGLDRLPSLQSLHVPYNRLTDVHEAASRLASLPLLRDVWLWAGNPWRWDTVYIETPSSTRRRPPSTDPTATERLWEAGAVLVWQARLERRRRSLPTTLRDILYDDPGLPRIDGAGPSARQWWLLRHRVARAVPLPPIAPPRRRPSRRRRRRPKVSAREDAMDFQHVYSIPNEIQPSFTVWDILNASSSLEEDDKIFVANERGVMDPASVTAVLEDSNGAAEERHDDLDDLDENIGQLYLDSIRMYRPSVPDSAVGETSIPEATVEDAAVESLVPFREDGEENSPLDPLAFRVNGDETTDQNSDPLDANHEPTPAAKTSAEASQWTSEPSVVVLSTPEKSMASRNGADDLSLPMPSSASSTSMGATLPSPISPTNTPTLALRVSSFSESQWTEDLSFLSTNRSNHTPGVSKSRSTEERPSSFVPQTATYDGPQTYRKIRILENLELYFRLFVFSATATTNEEENWQQVSQSHPRIQLWPVDRARRDEIRRRKNEQMLQFDLSNARGLVDHHAPAQETFHRVWNEKVVACGKAALRRLTPSRSARYGFHGELLWSAADTSQMRPEVVVECRETICCLSDAFFYIMVNHDTVTSKPMKDPKRDFPLPIPESACFQDAKWPHALACHALESLHRITIGFGFQRLTLYFQASSESFVYILLTCNKLETIALLKLFQELTSLEAETSFRPSVDVSNIRIENDDPLVLDSLGSAVAPDNVGVVLHYQILQQRWKSGGRGNVRRICVVTDAKLYLLDEDYVGDGSESIEVNGGNSASKRRNAQLGDCLHRLVDSADLRQIDYLQPADSDPNAVTIVMKPASALKRRHHWRLVCRDGRQGAERLVDDVRKAISNL